MDDTLADPVSEPVSPKEEWVRRFAYRAMLCEHDLDTRSAFMVAEGQFDFAYDLGPEEAAELYVTSTPHS